VIATHCKNIWYLLPSCFLILLLSSCGQDDQAPDNQINLSDFSPKTVLPGDTITISGDGFGSGELAISIALGDDNIGIASATDSEIKFVAPENSSTGTLSVSVGNISKDFTGPVTVLSLYLLSEEYVDDGIQLKYWKNKTSFDLTKDNFSETASGMDVHNGDVYVAGYGTLPVTHFAKPKYWVNGEGYTIANGTLQAYARAVKVEGGDVYVAGNGITEQGKRVGKVWKNNEVIFEGNGILNSSFNKVEIFQNAIYVAGSTDGARAAYWKDGIPVYLSNGQSGASVNDIAVTEGGVFAVGFHAYNAMFWKNSTGTVLKGIEASPYRTNATSIFVEGDDIYIGGAEYTTEVMSTAMFWKNGEPVALSTSGRRSVVSSIAVLNGNVYCAGYEYDASGTFRTGILWKNGVSQLITQADDYGVLNAVMIAE